MQTKVSVSEVMVARLYALVITANREPGLQYTKALQDAGYAVLIVTTGARAQVQLTFTNPDLIVLDLDLPDVSGDIILRQIMAQARFQNTSLILLSNQEEPARKKAGKHAQVVTKPVKSQRLAELASEAASRI